MYMYVYMYMCMYNNISTYTYTCICICIMSPHATLARTLSLSANTTSFDAYDNTHTVKCTIQNMLEHLLFVAPFSFHLTFKLNM